MAGSGIAGGGSGPRGRGGFRPPGPSPGGRRPHLLHAATGQIATKKSPHRRIRGAEGKRPFSAGDQMIGDTNPATETASRKVLTSGSISAEPPGRNTGRSVKSTGGATFIGAKSVAFV